jgi:Ser/Thr protein kinase RdoA (MazF antagonist)
MRYFIKGGDAMKYLNGKDLFPPDLLELIQSYIEGNYVYIPKKDTNREKWGAKTTYVKELEKRNSHIYTEYLTGFSINEIAVHYHLSEKTINRIITNKKKGAVIMKETIMELLKIWGIQSEIQQIYDTAWSVGNDYILKTNTELAGLERNIGTMKALHEYGIPVALPIPTKDGQDYIESNGVYYLLMNRLPGSHILDIYQEKYNEIACETGKAIAKLHNAFRACEEKTDFWDNNFEAEITGWVKDIMEANQYRYCTEEDFSESAKELQACYDKLPRQLIHRDMYYGNILFDNGVFSGYIDFDLSQKNVKIFDISYFLMGLLVDHVNQKEDVNKWYCIVSHFIKGYEEISELTTLEKDSICCFMENIELLFTAYFIREEDELLAENAAGIYYFVKQNNDTIKAAIYKYEK